jgi:hypothetical protein
MLFERGAVACREELPFRSPRPERAHAREAPLVAREIRRDE